MKTSNTIFLIASCALSTGIQAQNVQENSTSPVVTHWQQCSSLSHDDAARLACFDRWATQQNHTSSNPERPQAASQLEAKATATAQTHNCKNSQFSELSRFWELESGSDCGTFGIRGYQPISLSWLSSDSVNDQPSSPAAGHTAASSIPFGTTETRISLSVRTKIAQGLLTHDKLLKRDSLWFAYSQQSNWQIFSGDLSRPFRTTDHEPELIYIYPTDTPLPLGWRLRYSGISLNHQSNGQPLPLSRSWNRSVLMAGMEKGQQYHVQGKLWYRMPEDAAQDDNPDISDLIGRAEVAAFWKVNPDNTLGMTVRHSLRANTNGSLRLEWLKKLGDSGFSGNNSGLRFHTQLFSGYGDSLVDYNRKRTVFSVGLSLVDW